MNPDFTPRTPRQNVRSRVLNQTAQEEAEQEKEQLAKGAKTVIFWYLGYVAFWLFVILPVFAVVAMLLLRLVFGLYHWLF